MTKNQPIVQSLSSALGLLRGVALLCACSVLNCGTEAAAPAEPTELLAQLALSPSNPQMAQGTAQQFSLRGLSIDGRTHDLTAKVRWSVADERGRASAMPADGYLQLEQPGRYLITASYQGTTLTTPLVVTAATVKSVSLSPSAPKVAKGLSQAFVATALFSDATTQDVTKLATWAVKDVTGTGVATIDTNGVLLAKSVGKATITARYKSRSSSTTAEVTAATLNTLFVSPADPTIASGTSQRFTATGSYSDGTTTDLTSAATWAVTDLVGTGVAAIDGAGVANGKSVGTAQVSADFGGLTGETTLTVSPAVAVTVAISPASSSIAKGTTQHYAAIATLTDGTTQDVTAMAAWTATDRTGTGVASIDSSGLAKANAEGTSTISCAFRGHSASALLTVTPATLVGLTVNPTMAMLYQGQYGSLSAIGGYSDGSTQNLSTTAVWTTADLSGTDVASVTAGGRVFGKSVGKATITATAGGYSASAVVTVTPPTYTGLTITPSTNFAFSGGTAQFTALATLPDGSTKDVTTATTWSETDLSGTGIASIDSKGLARGLSTGLAGINASFSGYSAVATLFVF
jgi:hypothetical protein